MNRFRNPSLPRRRHASFKDAIGRDGGIRLVAGGKASQLDASTAFSSSDCVCGSPSSKVVTLTASLAFIDLGLFRTDQAMLVRKIAGRSPTVVRYTQSEVIYHKSTKVIQSASSGKVARPTLAG
jgi:hypothetical protein